MDRAEIAVGTVCEIGPVQIRRLASDTAELIRTDPVLTSAALDGDDPMIMVGTRPMALHEAWQTLLEPLLCGKTPTLLVHPSWWSGPRIDNVREFARRLSGDVVTKPRSWLLASITGGAPVVEIGPQIVTVTVDGAAPSGFQRHAMAPSDIADSVVQMVLRAPGGGPVWLDDSTGVPGADALAGQVTERLQRASRAVRRVGDRELFSAAADLVAGDDVPADQSRRSGHRRFIVAATVAVTATAAGMWAGADRVGQTETAAVQTTALVEGHVTMQIPAIWAIRRITTGPGSARVEAISPDDSEAALHLTQASVPDDGLAAAAATLRRAIDEEPAGIFVDFDPDDERAGRPAITYREIRPGHEIRWAVVLDGNMRIGIGCQSGADSADLAAACDEAVRSAHEIG